MLTGSPDYFKPISNDSRKRLPTRRLIQSQKRDNGKYLDKLWLVALRSASTGHKYRFLLVNLHCIHIHSLRLSNIPIYIVLVYPAQFTRLDKQYVNFSRGLRAHCRRVLTLHSHLGIPFVLAGLSTVIEHRVSIYDSFYFSAE